jgi:hypothetical protein
MSRILRNNIAFTDYPLDECVGALMVEVEMLAYDRDKYVTVRYGEQVTSIKRCYLYLAPDMEKLVTRKQLYRLPLEVDGSMRTRRQVHHEMMLDRRRKKTTYDLFIDDQFCGVYTTLHEALRQFGMHYKQMNCLLRKTHSRGFDSIALSVVESEDGQLFIPTYRQRHTFFKMKHHFKYIEKGAKNQVNV